MNQERKFTPSRLAIMFSIVVLLLLLPLAGMLFSEQVNWSVFDFIVAGLLLSTTCLLLELILRKVGSKRMRLALCLLLLGLLLVIWVELAVGIFGSPFAGS